MRLLYCESNIDLTLVKKLFQYVKIINGVAKDNYYIVMEEEIFTNRTLQKKCFRDMKDAMNYYKRIDLNYKG